MARAPIADRLGRPGVPGRESILSIRVSAGMRRDLDEIALGFRVPVDEVARMAVEHCLRIWMGRDVRDPGNTVASLPPESPKAKRKTRSS